MLKQLVIAFSKSTIISTAGQLRLCDAVWTVYCYVSYVLMQLNQLYVEFGTLRDKLRQTNYLVIARVAHSPNRRIMKRSTIDKM